MEEMEKDLRTHKRNFIEPYDTGTYLELDLRGERFRLNLLDTSPGGMGMLVKKEESDILEFFGIGDQIRAEYKIPEAGMPVNLEIRHITLIERGRFKGHYQVGLSLIPGPGPRFKGIL